MTLRDSGMTYTLHSVQVLHGTRGPPSIAPFVGSHVKKKGAIRPIPWIRACTSCNLRVIRLITLLHSVAHFVSVLLNISSVFGMACARLQVFKRPAAGSSLDRIRFQHPCGHATVTESSHRPWHQLGWPRRLQVLEQALSHGQDVPPGQARRRSVRPRRLELL